MGPRWARRARLIADTEIDRREEGALLDYIKAKYGPNVTLTFEPTHARAAVVVPRSEPV